MRSFARSDAQSSNHWHLFELLSASREYMNWDDCVVRVDDSSSCFLRARNNPGSRNFLEAGADPGPSFQR